LRTLWNYELDRLILEEENWADLAAKGRVFGGINMRVAATPRFSDICDKVS
jgi:hypothetical protein